LGAKIKEDFVKIKRVVLIARKIKSRPEDVEGKKLCQ